MDVYKKTLHSAWNSPRPAQLPAQDNAKLKYIIQESNHKTYRYILLTGLLGAAAAQNNPLCLQKGAEVDRAWDARTVCHHTLVPFERDYLDGALGKSNEPFLNKPARFKTLSINNAVRAGRDKEALKQTIDVLSNVDRNGSAFEYLVVALRLAAQIKPSKKVAIASSSAENFKQTFEAMLQNPHQGFSLLLFSYIFLNLIRTPQSIVDVYPLNQSGSSSKQIGDIDIKDKGTKEVLLAAEVKDKNFSVYDISHAMRKAKEAGSDFCFITRQRYLDKAIFESGGKEHYIRDVITCEGILSLTSVMASRSEKGFLEKLINSALKSTNPNGNIADHVRNCFESSGVKE